MARRLSPVNPKLLFLGVCIFAHLCAAEEGKLVVQVEDTQNRPVKGAEIGIEGNGGSGVTGSDGKAVLALGNATNERDWVTLYLLHSPPGKDFVMISPWDYRTMVPSFADKPENFIKIVVVQRGDRAVLENGTVLAALVAKINKENAPKSSNKLQAYEDPKAALNAVAKQYGLEPEELDKQIRAWGAKTVDPYEAGLAALYERSFPEASTQLQASLKVREDKLAVDQKTVEADQKAVADAAFFLGASLYEQGKYKESADAYSKCLKLTPDNPIVLNNLAMSLTEAGEYSGAEPLFRRALAINEKALGLNHTYVALSLNNLAILLDKKGDYAGEEPLLRRALAINEKALGPENPEVAGNLGNLGELLRAKGDYAGAEPLYRRALAINEKALGPDDPNVAVTLNNLAGLLTDEGDYASAEPLYRRALAIDEKALGPDHPNVAGNLGNLGELLSAKGDYSSAEPLYRRALAIDEKALMPDHPDVAIRLINLADLLKDKGDYTGAEPLYRRALAIDEKALGPNHTTVAGILNNLALLLDTKGDHVGAEPLYSRALAIDEKALGPNHSTVAGILNNLALLLDTKGDYTGAEGLLRRALIIDEIALGPGHPTTMQIQKNLDDTLEAAAKGKDK